ncbi:hypothetical protein C8R45DRAFT_930054 [Mycena sanguinolenta]|nr:hypothetical protein C8R45DRAFT_930054 [Mycena sanguinolenta]
MAIVLTGPGRKRSVPPVVLLVGATDTAVKSTAEGPTPVEPSRRTVVPSHNQVDAVDSRRVKKKLTVVVTSPWRSMRDDQGIRQATVHWIGVMDGWQIYLHEKRRRRFLDDGRETFPGTRKTSIKSDIPS